MKLTAITKFKQGDLWAALKQLDWNQAELAQHCRLSASSLGEIMNLRRRPTVAEAGKIQEALGEQGIYLDILEVWPESFPGFGISPVIERIADVPTDRLLPTASATPMLAAHHTDIRELIEAELNYRSKRCRTVGGLTKQEIRVLRALYVESPPQTMAQLAKTLSVSVKRIRAVVKYALLKLRDTTLTRSHVPEFKNLFDPYYGAPEARVDVETAAGRELRETAAYDKEEYIDAFEAEYTNK